MCTYYANVTRNSTAVVNGLLHHHFNLSLPKVTLLPDTMNKLKSIFLKPMVVKGLAHQKAAKH